MDWRISDVTSALSWYDSKSVDQFVILGTNKVKVWRDKINNYDAGQNGKTNLPELISNVINGKSVVRFNGTNSLRLSSQPLIAETLVRWVTAIVRPALFGSIGNGFFSLAGDSIGAGSVFDLCIEPDKFSVRVIGNAIYSYSFSLNTPVLIDVLWESGDSRNISVRINGESIAYTSGSVATINTNAGTYASIGATPGQPGVYYSGDVGSIVFGGVGRTLTDCNKIEGALAHSFGMSGVLPAGHPYKSSPPIYPTIGGNAIILGGSPVGYVSIFDAADNAAKIDDAIPDSAGDWSENIPVGSYYFLFVADGYPSKVSGPHTVSELGVSPAIPDVVLGSSNGTTKTVGYPF